MLSRVAIKNFQSITDVDLKLGSFVVCVGASSSGKSAFVRALKLLTKNASGTSYVTQGQKTCVVAAETDGHTVSVERGANTSRYVLDGEAFDKCGKTTPGAVDAVLKVSDLSFAGQFDKPYLLDSSGSEVARELGELTNVSTIFEAVREGNRRKSEAGGKVKTRESDLEALKADVVRFKNLASRIAGVVDAETLLQTAEATAAKRKRLFDIASTLMVADSAVARLSVEQPPVPDLDALLSAQAKRAQFMALMTQIAEDRTKERRAASRSEDAAKLEEKLHTELHNTLEEAGVCPTCQQSTKNLTLA